MFGTMYLTGLERSMNKKFSFFLFSTGVQLILSSSTICNAICKRESEQTQKYICNNRIRNSIDNKSVKQQGMH